MEPVRVVLDVVIEKLVRDAIEPTECCHGNVFVVRLHPDIGIV